MFKMDTFKNIQNNFIHNSPKLKLTPMSINNRKDKYIVVHSYVLFVQAAVTKYDRMGS